MFKLYKNQKASKFFLAKLKIKWANLVKNYGFLSTLET